MELGSGRCWTAPGTHRNTAWRMGASVAHATTQTGANDLFVIDECLPANVVHDDGFTTLRTREIALRNG